MNILLMYVNIYIYSTLKLNVSVSLVITTAGRMPLQFSPVKLLRIFEYIRKKNYVPLHNIKALTHLPMYVYMYKGNARVQYYFTTIKIHQIL